MSELRFEWDQAKAVANKRKHGVSFEEAQTIFLDKSAVLIDDPDHSRAEERFLLVGLSAGLRTLTVSHCYRKADDVFESFQLAKQPGKNGRPIVEGGADEKGIRLFEGSPEPLCGTVEAASDDTT